MRARPQRGEGLSSGMRGEQSEAGEQQYQAEVCHHRVPDARLAHRGAFPVFGQHQQQRGERHQLPQHEEGGHRRGHRDQDQREREQRQHRLRRTRAQPVRAVPGRVADAVHGDRGHDGSRDREEQTGQGVHGHMCSGQRKQPGKRGRPAAPAECGDARGDASRSHAGRQNSGDRDTGPVRQGEARERARAAQCGGRRQGGRDQVHRPVTLRSAATICSGSGGHPGTARSTGTTSETAPSMP